VFCLPVNMGVSSPFLELLCSPLVHAKLSPEVSILHTVVEAGDKEDDFKLTPPLLSLSEAVQDIIRGGPPPVPVERVLERVVEERVEKVPAKCVPDWPGVPPEPIVCYQRNSFIELCEETYDVEGFDIGVQVYPLRRRANSQMDLRAFEASGAEIDFDFWNAHDDDSVDCEVDFEEETWKAAPKVAQVPPPLPEDGYRPKWAYGPRWPFNRAPTSITLSNLPFQLTQNELIQVLDREGFCGFYDFVFVPCCFQTGRNYGTAIVNLTSHRHGNALAARFHRFCDWGCGNRRPCEVKWSLPLQGLAEHMETYRNHEAMHENVPEAFRPMMFVEGWQVPFPYPTEWIPAPRLGW